MKRGEVVDLEGDLAIMAAELSAELRLPLADSVILATARSAGATLWTQDSEFMELDGVEYRAHRG
jgi:toxin FitB